MNALTNLIPILIIYSSLIVYFFNYNLSPFIENTTVPIIIYFISYLFVTHGIGGSILSLYASYTHCKRYSIYTILTSGIRMFAWMTIITLILFFFDGFITPFQNIWINADANKINTIAFSFYLSIFCILSGIIVYYDSKTNSCGPDANVIEQNVKELDDSLNGIKKSSN